MDAHRLLFETDTEFAHYQVWDTVYSGRPARVLYSGQRFTAQSGVAQDDRPELLFDYNQRMFELATALQPARLLLIGGGAYTLPTALLTSLPHTQIDVVEIDEALEKIAREFFGLPHSPRLGLVCGDGRQYLEQNQQPYDLILVDAFMHASTPNTLRSLEAIKQYRRNLTSRGVFARNVISAYQGPVAASLHRHLDEYDSVFPDVRVYPAGIGLPLILSQNLIVVAQADTHWPVDSFLRHPVLARRQA